MFLKEAAPVHQRRCSTTVKTSQKRVGHVRNGYESSQIRKQAIAAKTMQVGLAEDLLKTWEELPDGKRDYDRERHLRAKVRQKRNELQAMGI